MSVNPVTRVIDWAENLNTPAWKGLSVIIGIPFLILAVIVTTLILTLGGASCPAGQVFSVTGWTAGTNTVNGGYVPPQAVYGCVPKQ